MLTAHAIATVALGLLSVAGVAKLVDPDPTSGALRAARLPSRRWVVRSMGATELLVGVAGVLGFAPALGAAAVAYVAFCSFTLWALRTDRPIQSCGCFGSVDTPPGMIHVIVNLVAAASLAVLWAAGAAPIPDLAAGEVVLYLAMAGLGVFATYLLLAVLPQTLRAARP